MMPSKADFTETVNSAKNLLAYRAATSIFKMSKSVLETIWRRASVHAEEAVRSSIAFVQQAVNAQGLLVAGLALAALALLPGLASLASLSLFTVAAMVEPTGQEDRVLVSGLEPGIVQRLVAGGQEGYTHEEPIQKEPE
jgi:hypothetical protein